VKFGYAHAALNWHLIIVAGKFNLTTRAGPIDLACPSFPNLSKWPSVLGAIDIFTNSKLY